MFRFEHGLEAGRTRPVPLCKFLRVAMCELWFDGSYVDCTRYVGNYFGRIRIPMFEITVVAEWGRNGLGTDFSVLLRCVAVLV